MQIKIVQDTATRFLKENTATVLTAGGVVGTVATAVLAARAGFKAAHILEEERDRERKVMAEPDLHVEISKTDKVKLVWPHFIPPVVVGGVTVGSIIMSHRMSAAKAAALAAAYGVSQKQLEEYKAKVLEKLGEQKEEKIRDELAQDRVNENPNSTQVIIIGDNVLCYDQPTDRYFQSSMEKIRTVEHKANREIIENGYYEASEFYIELGLEGTTWSDDVGWIKPFNLEYTTVQAPDGRPCLAIDFSKLPQSDYVRDHSRYSP